MLQTLKNKSKKTLLIKIRIKNFIKQQLLSYILVFASIIICSWLFNRMVEGFLFCIAHTCVRNSFPKQFHFTNTYYCLCLTLFIVWVSIPLTLPVSVSLLSSIVIAFVIALAGYIAQDRVDTIVRLKRLTERRNIYAMSEDELYKYCRSKGLDEGECKIAHYVVIERLKGRELYEAIGYSEIQTKRKRKKILDILSK